MTPSKACGRDAWDVHDRGTLRGVQVSAVFLVLLGFLFAIYTIFCFVIVCTLAHRRAHGASPRAHGGILSSFVATCVCAGLMYVCFRAASGLRNAKPWAAYVAMTFGTLLLPFSGAFFYDCLHPERLGPDAGFGILVMPFTVGAGLWWVVYLNLPHVRRALRSERSVPRR